MADVRTTVQINDPAELVLPLMREGVPVLRIGETFHGHAVDIVLHAATMSPHEQATFLRGLARAASELAGRVVMAEHEARA